jgi:hypothetical protein
VLPEYGPYERQQRNARLAWRDVDLSRGTAMLHHTKNNERRTLVLSGRALAVLCELSAVRRIGTDAVFAAPDGVARFRRDAWEHALREANIPDFGFHDLRHTFASYLAMSGATLADLAEALGHKTLAMVKRYAHLTDHGAELGRTRAGARGAERCTVQWSDEWMNPQRSSSDFQPSSLLTLQGCLVWQTSNLSTGWISQSLTRTKWPLRKCSESNSSRPVTRTRSAF